MSITIRDLVNAIELDDIQLQILSNGAHQRTLKGKGAYSEIKFDSAPDSMKKEALILWVDRKKLDAAIDAVKSQKAINHD